MAVRVMGSKLRQLRERKLLTLKELAALSGVGYVTISRLENERQAATFATIKKLAAALEVDPGELVRKGRR